MIIKSKKIWIGESFVPAQVEIKDGKITGVFNYDDNHKSLDYKDSYVLPGLIDLHCHGNAAIDFKEISLEKLEKWSLEMAKEGVTSFLPTSATMKYEDNIRCFSLVKDYMKEGHDHAEVLGINIEGNFINPKRAGAQDKRYISERFNIEELQAYIKASGANIKMLTLAPELDRGYQLIEFARDKDIFVNAGHTDAQYQDIEKARDHGLKGFTHTYNAMRPFHHRQVGVIAAALNMEDMYAEVIADGFHVSWPAVDILCKLKSKDRLVLVTDSIALKKSDLSSYQGFHKDPDGQVRTGEGRLAGSVLQMNQAIKNILENTSCPMVKAINAATINPARIAGVASRKGTIELGKDADISIFDEDWNVIGVICRGKVQEI